MDQSLQIGNTEQVELDIMFIKAAVKHNLEDISKSLNANEIVSLLYTKDVITVRQFEHVKKVGENKGRTSQADQLLLYILQNEDEVKLEKFMEVLKKKQENLHEMLKTTASKIASGEIKTATEATIEGIREELVKAYKHLNKITALPGEPFKVDLTDEEQVMPWNFTAHQLEDDTKLAKQLSDHDHRAKYKQVDFASVDEIFKVLSNSQQSRTILCTAFPGMGKTCLVHSMVLKWMNKSEQFDKYDIVWVLKVRDIDVSAPLAEILGKGRQGLSYISDAPSLEPFLSLPTHAAKILFIVDGVDEKVITKDCELYKLIIGELYPDTKLMITSRPEAPILTELKQLPASKQPSFKIELHGTTEEGVQKYLENKVGLNENNPEELKEEEVQGLLQRCKDKMVNVQLLFVPLYLTLIGFIFNIHWAEHLSFKEFIVPDTTTKLFNAFFVVIIRTWLERLRRKEEAKNVKFDMNPISENSTVPLDIKLKLVAFGKMSYNMITQQTYDFTEKDLAKYLIDINDIKESGLFCMSSQNEKVLFFYRHKQFQEYMSALFISNERLEYMPFSKILAKIETSPTKQPLQVMFNEIHVVMPFLFGFVPEFAIILLNKVKHQICIAKSGDKINLHYEAQLCLESSNEDVDQLLRNLIVESEITENKDYRYRGPLSTLYRFTQGFSTDQGVSMLDKWFDLTVSEEGNKWVISNNQVQDPPFWNKFFKCCVTGGRPVSPIPSLGPSSFDLTILDPPSLKISESSLQIQYLYDLFFFVILQFKGNSLDTLNIEKTDITDVGLIQHIFPNIQQLHINAFYSSADESLSALTPQSHSHHTLKHVVMKGRYETLSAPSVTSLVQQSELQSLRLGRVDLLTNLPQTDWDIHWSNLTTLEMCFLELRHENTPIQYSTLTRLLQHTPQLCVLRLGCSYIKTTNLSYVRFGCSDNFTTNLSYDIIKPLLQSIPTNCPHLHTLCLYNAVKPENIETLCGDLQNLPQVTTLGLGEEDIRWREDVLVNSLMPLKHIKQLLVMHGTEASSKACASYPYDDLKKQQSQSQLSLHTDIQTWEWDLTPTCSIT